MFTKCHVVSGQRTIIDKSHRRHLQPIQSPWNNDDKTKVILDRCEFFKGILETVYECVVCTRWYISCVVPGVPAMRGEHVPCYKNRRSDA